MVLVLNRSEMQQLASLEDCVAAVERAFRAYGEGRSLGLARVHLDAPAGGTFHLVAGGIADDAGGSVALKLNGRFPPLPGETGQRVAGAVLLSDAATGVPVALMDSMVVTVLRTAAVTALVVRLLARTGARTALVIGAGRQSSGQIDALQLAGIDRILVFDTSAENAARAAEHASQGGLRGEVAASIAEAAAVADVIVTITPARAPILLREHVRPGTLVIALGADGPGKQELDPALVAASRLVVDLVEQAADSGELQHALAASLMTIADVHAELGEIMAGLAAGRASDDDIVVFDGTGTALQDVAAAQLLVEEARAEGAGVTVDLV